MDLHKSTHTNIDEKEIKQKTENTKIEIKIKQLFKKFEKAGSMIFSVLIMWNVKQFCSDPVELIYQKLYFEGLLVNGSQV